MARSPVEAKNNPRFPEVLDDSPTVMPWMWVQTRLVSESTATCMASFNANHVLMSLKLHDLHLHVRKRVERSRHPVPVQGRTVKTLA